jgi:hypothetical protein
VHDLEKWNRFSEKIMLNAKSLDYDPIQLNWGIGSIFKRGMKGVYQHCKEKHLHRYLAEYDFRDSNRIKLGIDDGAWTVRALQGITGKRLTYRGPPAEQIPF